MKHFKWVTITLNPAIDLTGAVEVLSVKQVNTARQLSVAAAGKGINVAKVLSDLGADVTVSGFLGSENQEIFTQFFDVNRFNNKFVMVPGTTRTNIKLCETSGDTTDINFNGFAVTDENIKALEQTLYELAKNHDGFIFSGSLPENLSEEQVVIWMKSLNALGKKVVLDSSKSMLRAGTHARPWMIKPNESEVSELLGREVVTIEDGMAAARELSATGIEHVLVSMGEKGLLWFSRQCGRFANAPRVIPVSSVGAGDSVVATFCWAATYIESPKRQLAYAAAMGAIAVQQANVGVEDMSLLQEWADKVVVEAL